MINAVFNYPSRELAVSYNGTLKSGIYRQLRIMDGAAFSLCMENKIPIIVLNFFENESFENAVMGHTIGDCSDIDPRPLHEVVTGA